MASTLFATLSLIASIATFSGCNRRATAVTFTSSDGSKATMHIDKLRDIELLNVRSGQKSRLPLDVSRHTIVVILSGGDCPNMLRERQVWSELINEYSREELQVIGLLVRTSLPEASTFLNGFDLPFPVFLDEGNELRKLTQVPSITPFKLLLTDGAVVITEGPRSVAAGIETFADKVRTMTRGAGGT